MDNERYFIERILPYRLEAVEVLGLALRYRLSWTDPVPMEIHFEGNLSIEGLSSAFTNPAIEAGIIHCRALLEFIGLRVDRNDHKRLSTRSSSRPDDLMIESFANGGGRLQVVTPAEAVAPYEGPPDEAEQALARVIHIANKGLAHSTVGLINNSDDLRLCEIASRGVRALLVRHFYKPLGLKAPVARVRSRTRRDDA